MYNRQNDKSRPCYIELKRFFCHHLLNKAKQNEEESYEQKHQRENSDRPSSYVAVDDG